MLLCLALLYNNLETKTNGNIARGKMGPPTRDALLNTQRTIQQNLGAVKNDQERALSNQKRQKPDTSWGGCCGKLRESCGKLREPFIFKHLRLWEVAGSCGEGWVLQDKNGLQKGSAWNRACKSSDHVFRRSRLQMLRLCRSKCIDWN